MCRLVEQTVLSDYCRFNYVLSLSASLVIELDYLNKILTSHSFSHSFFFFAASSSAISCSRCRFLEKRRSATHCSLSWLPQPEVSQTPWLFPDKCKISLTISWPVATYDYLLLLILPMNAREKQWGLNRSYVYYKKGQMCSGGIPWDLQYYEKEAVYLVLFPYP